MKNSISYPSKALFLLLGFFLFHFQNYGQKKSDIEIIKNKYLNGIYKKNEELSILKKIASDINDPQEKLKYSNLLFTIAKEKDSSQYFFDAYMQIGNALRLKGDLTEALENFYKAAETAKGDEKELELIGLSNITIADVYSIMGNHENAVNYYKTGIQNLREAKSDSLKLASALLNAGDEFFNADKLEEAMSYFYESSLISNKIGFTIGNAYNLGNIGMVYAKQGKHNMARANIDEAIEILEAEKDYYPIAVYLDYIANIYLDQKQPKLAKPYAIKSLDLAKKYQLKEQISNSDLKLSEIYELLNDPEKSLYHLKEHITYKDSVSNINSVQKMADLRTEFEVEKKQVELDLLAQKREADKYITRSIIIGLGLMSLLAFGLLRRNRYIKKTTKIIEEERKHSDKLLLNLLPEEAAIELKQNGFVKSQKFECVTVLFTDFKGFTKIAESLPPEQIVKSVDFYFSKFDEIIKKHHLEKIKTIGDAYMCASGLPIPNDNHAKNAIEAAKEMLEFVKESKKKHAVNEARFDIRIGLHSGSVVSGVVGKDKFAYDIWGDTVNIASRVESASEAGKINVSETTYKFVKGEYEFEERGEIAIKNRSGIAMYFLKC